MKNKWFCFLILVQVVLLNSCYYDKADALAGGPSVSTCDTTTAATFSAKVLPILASSCNGCHGGSASAGAGIILDTYTGVKKYATNGSLMNSINHTGGASPMPKGGGSLPACDIKTIQRWINAGMLNN